MEPLVAIASQLLGNKRKMGETPTSSLTGIVRLAELAASSQQSKRERITPTPTIEETPAEFVARVFREKGLDSKQTAMAVTIPFVKPTEEMIAAYRTETLFAARSGDVEKLRRLLKSGALLDCCNRFGESLIHLACRRGNLDMVRFLVTEAKVTLLIRDDYGRTILHDACWTPEPQFDLVEYLLELVPDFLCVRDVRGHAPLDYARHEHHSAWLDFLRLRQDKMLPKLLGTKQTTAADTANDN